MSVSMIAARSPPRSEPANNQSDVFAARGHPRFGRQAVNRTLQHENGIKLLNRLESDRRDRRPPLVACVRGDIGKLEQFASRVRPASGFGDRSRLSRWLVEPIEAGIGVGLKNPAIASEMLLGMDARSIR